MTPHQLQREAPNPQSRRPGQTRNTKELFPKNSAPVVSPGCGTHHTRVCSLLLGLNERQDFHRKSKAKASAEHLTVSPGGEIGQCCRQASVSAHPSQVLPVTFPSFLWGRTGFEETPSACRAQDQAGARRGLRTFENRQPFQRWSRGSPAGKLPPACGSLAETCQALALGWGVSSSPPPEAQLGGFRRAPVLRGP